MFKGVTTQSLKLRIQSAFGDQLKFFQKKEGNIEYVYSADVPVEQDERSWFFLSDNEKVKKIAKMIKTKIDSCDSPFTSWPPNSNEICSKNVIIPELLETFLKTLFTNSSIFSQRIERLVRSIGQDIVYNSTRGKLKTIKHVQLGILTKRKTGSKFLINCLNRLGHSMSYDEVNSVETAFAVVQSKEKNFQSYVPNNVQPSTFITFVYDNCDHNAETLHGISMHCTNGIIIQKSDVEIRTPLEIET